MSSQIPVGFTEEFSSNVALLVQQMGSRFRNAVTVKGYTGKTAQVVHQLGAVAATRRTTRHSDTPIEDIPHDARWLFPVDYERAALIDKQDDLRTIASFDGGYAQTIAESLNRAIDDEIIAAIFSDTTKTGEDAGTTTDWTTFVSNNANHQIAAGAAGLTAAKIKQGLKALREAEVNVEMERIFCGVSAEQIEDLQLEDQYINFDYSTGRVLNDGSLKPFLGVNFIHSERLPLSGSDRRCPMWAESGMALGVFGDVEGRISERDDKSYAKQVYGCATIGATRVEEKKVVEIICAE